MESVEKLREIVARLRGPGGCPWDQEQTHQSIRAQLLEECHEVLEAIDERDDANLREELGDVLLHVVFHAQLAAERGAFDLNDVGRDICDKIVRRHPHVFGDEAGTLSDSAAVLKRWDELKRHEKPQRESLLDGVPKILPALMLAQETQKKAAKAGFDWPDITGVLAKVREEVDELEADLQHPQKAQEEFGDLMFALVSVARHLGIDAEQSCRDATHKFARRFRHAEKSAAEQGIDLKACGLEELNTLWDAAKKHRL